MRAVELDVGARGADDDVEVEADVRGGEPGGVVRAEADGVVACVVGGEGEPAFGGPFGFDDYFAGFDFLWWERDKG